MYCSGCGTQIQTGLNYCSRCGRRAADDADATSVAKSLASALGYIPGVGFFCYIFVLVVLLKNGIPGNQIIPISFIYFAVLFGMFFFTLRQAAALSKGSRSASYGFPPNEEAAGYSSPVETARLRQLREPGIGSVIENTTRTLDKEHVER